MDKLHSIFNQQTKDPVLAALWKEQGKLPSEGKGNDRSFDDHVGAIEGEKDLIESMVLDSLGMTPEEMIAKFQVDMNSAGKECFSYSIS